MIPFFNQTESLQPRFTGLVNNEIYFREMSVLCLLYPGLCCGASNLNCVLQFDYGPRSSHHLTHGPLLPGCGGH